MGIKFIGCLVLVSKVLNLIYRSERKRYAYILRLIICESLRD